MLYQKLRQQPIPLPFALIFKTTAALGSFFLAAPAKYLEDKKPIGKLF